MARVVVSGGFDDIRSTDIRFLQEAGAGGALEVLLWEDALVAAFSGKAPKFPLAERQYFLESLRYVSKVVPIAELTDAERLPAAAGAPAFWAIRQDQATPARRDWSEKTGIALRIIPDSLIQQFGVPLFEPPTPGKKKVVVTGCYDWFHSGHVRFFEEAGEFGDLYVVVGHDENIRLLKGEGHPLFPATERRFVAGSVKFVKQALISSGNGWMDAEPEFARIRPDYYVVNEDGDKPEKRAWCEKAGVDYKVLKRMPRPGLPRRMSTDLRGF